jgi:hypothetical protein
MQVISDISPVAPDASSPIQITPDMTHVDAALNPVDAQGTVSEPLPEKLEDVFSYDRVYASMQRTTDLHVIRTRLSMRYTLIVFLFFLTFLWITSNRVIMFGLSDFPLLARIRDALLVVMSGLFSLTLWYGADVWFMHILGRTIVRAFGVLFFVLVVTIFYFPSFLS